MPRAWPRRVDAISYRPLRYSVWGLPATTLALAISENGLNSRNILCARCEGCLPVRARLTNALSEEENGPPGPCYARAAGMSLSRKTLLISTLALLGLGELLYAALASILYRGPQDQMVVSYLTVSV